MTDSSTEIVPYSTPEGLTIGVRFNAGETWVTQDELAQLYGRDKSVISRHLKSAFDGGELDRKAVVAEFATTASDGKTYFVDHYNLDAILAVGYRVKSQRGTDFRVWATKQLRRDIEGTGAYVDIAPQVAALTAGFQAMAETLKRLEARTSAPVETHTRIGKRKGDEVREQIRLLGEAWANRCPKHSARAWAQKRNLRFRNSVAFPLGKGHGWDNLPSGQWDKLDEEIKRAWEDVNDMGDPPPPPKSDRQAELPGIDNVKPISRGVAAVTEAFDRIESSVSRLHDPKKGASK